jgi:hypothetical protein
VGLYILLAKKEGGGDKDTKVLREELSNMRSTEDSTTCIVLIYTQVYMILPSHNAHAYMLIGI